MALPRQEAWSRFVALTVPFFRSELRWRAFVLLGVLVALVLSVSGLNVLMSYVGRDFMTALADRHTGRFATLGAAYIAVFALATLVAVFNSFTEQRLGLMWREWLTKFLIARYLGNKNYYRVNARGDVDNPDQRIAEDVRTFTSTTLSLMLVFLNSGVALLSFSTILCSITPLLLVAVIVYALLGSLMTVLLGRRLVGLDVVQLRREADFRYDLIRVRSNAESIAMLRGEKRENRRLIGRLAAVVDNMKRIIAINRNLGFFTTGYNYLIQIIPVLIVAPLYFREEIEFGTVTQSAMAFDHAVRAFSVIVTQFGPITTFAAVIARLGVFWEATVPAGAEAAALPQIETVEDPARLAYERLTLRTPREGRVLVRDLSLQVPRGKRLLIMGANGSGRTSLLRATAGLWKRGEGQIVRPPLEQVLFLPQQPYLESGLLREQLLFATGDEVSDERIQAVLRRLDFEPVLERVGGLYAEADWPSILCLSEQQVLAFARLLLTGPRYAFLDEATSAIDSPRARQLYRVLSATTISYVSVATDPSLAEFHDALLELGEDGGWQVNPRQQVVSA
jgi:putative ATP-binding cassette transporter